MVGLNRASFIDGEKPRLGMTQAFSEPGRQQHDTVITNPASCRAEFPAAVKPARLQPVMDAPRSWPLTRPHIAFVRQPQRCRCPRCPCLVYARQRSRRERLLLVYERPLS